MYCFNKSSIIYFPEKVFSAITNTMIEEVKCECGNNCATCDGCKNASCACSCEK